jgi:hypothetical protein
MNLLLKFDSKGVRDEFVERLRTRHPEVLEFYVPAKTKPHALVENIDSTQADWVRDSARGLGRVFDDLQFEPFGE